MAKLWQISKGHPKPAFSVKAQTGDQGKFLKNRPKSSPRLKGPKALWRKYHYPLICTQSYGNFREIIQNPHFLKKCKGGIKGTFSKIAKEDALAKKA